MDQTFVMDPDWLCFDPAPSKPKFVPPAGAVDAHCHVFGPGARFPYAPERKYTPCDASADQLFALRDHLGFSRNVIVQATCHGTDNAAMLDALERSDGRARGVAAVGADISAQALARMHQAGVRAVRFNYVRRLVDPKPDAFYRRIIDKIAPLGWHVVIYFEAADLAEKQDFFASLPTPVIVDHMGRPDVRQAPEGPAFGQFLQFMAQNPHIYCKVTCPERLSRQGPPYADVIPFARTVVERFPNRVLWGTDWPHPNLNMVGHMPDDGALVDMIAQIAPSADLQQRLLVDNPVRLYWPEASA